MGALILHPARAFLTRGQCRLVHRRRYEAGRNGVDTDVERRKFASQAFGKPHDGSFRAGIGAVVGKWTERAAPGEVDDPGLVALLKLRKRMVDEKISSLQIGFHRRPPAV